MINLQAGQVQVVYQNGFLRYLKVNQKEVMRMLYFAIRDQNWGNFKPTLFDEKIEENKDSFRIKYKVKYDDFFIWNVEINGLNNNEIHFEINGEVLQEFSTNRAGFCVLHPIENIAGEKVKITHSSSSETNYLFPKFISPHQPFVDILGMKWGVENSEFSLHFLGDIFETEDQRNWGDASYKTYCTPLHLPFPKQMKIGEAIHQKVIFIANIVENNLTDSQKRILEAKPFHIGICESSAKEAISKTGIEKLKSLHLSHYCLEVFPSELGWKERLLNQIKIGLSLCLAFEIALVLSDEYEKELSQFSEIVLSNSSELKYLILLSSRKLVTNQTVIDSIPNLKVVFSETKIGVGTLYNFTEINRERFDAKEADFITFSFDPQEHASDDLSILENAETVKYFFESAQEIYHKPVHISPILLKRRFNPYATDPMALNIPIEKQVDSRQKTTFLAQWTILLLENLAVSGVESVTLFQTHGDVGLMEKDGDIFPVYQAIKKR